MKGYNKKLSDVYVLPLPYEIKELPPLIPHNPLSLCIYFWALIKRLRQPSPTPHAGEVLTNDDGNGCHGIRVTDPASMIDLWQQGFFGKGTLSRSEPSWFGRTARRMGLDGGEMSLEEITEMRRAKRRTFKQERELQQHRELAARMQQEGKVIPESLQRALQPVLSTEKSTPGPGIRQEDKDLVIGDTITRLEYLHLSPCESVFLSLGLGVLQIKNGDHTLTVSEILQALLPTPKLWHEYVVYHQLRSTQWCVRSGVKFGVDWLLYRKGPPFQHAEFAIMVLNNSSQRNWAWLHSTMRVVSSAKKTLMFVYVEPSSGSATMPDWSQVNTVLDFRNTLRDFMVKPITFSRFAPSRNRD